MKDPTHMNTDRYESLAQRGQDWARLVASLRRIEAAVASIPMEPFFEPVAQLVSRGLDNPATLAAITAPHLDAWTRHVAYGTIVRLDNLTGPCLELLGENQLIAAGLFERAILEHAARAAYSLEALTGAYKSGSWDKMRELIPKMLFGTCLTNPEDTIFEELAEATAQRPTKPSKFIASLEAFAGTSEAIGKSFFGGLHSVLCDLTHASQRANSAFCEVLSDTGSGWFLKYRKTEEEKDEALLGALRATARCLQAGYGASALLLRWSFDDGMPNLVASAPVEKDMAWIWSEILDPQLVFW
ncbi:MAG TPA: hypothetical protein VE957_04470 [Terriglobales bacterium]|nr:hypothetical protein [Terriglobales bacterium]